VDYAPQDQKSHQVKEDLVMLVLSRKEGEQLVIDENIVITVTRLAGHRVSIGIEAPPHVRVMRGELDSHLARETEFISAGI
jgi:carbon storage regulator CsrA